MRSGHKYTIPYREATRPDGRNCMEKDKVKPSSGGLSSRQAAQRRCALRHYIEWQERDLPSLPYEVCLYLAHRYSCGKGGINLTLAALSAWHTQNGFPDPTQCPSVVRLAHHINRCLSPRFHPTLQPPPSILDVMLLAEAHKRCLCAETSPDGKAREDLAPPKPPSELIIYRNKAILLIGFWFGLTTAEVCELKRSDIKITKNSLEITTNRITEGRARYSYRIGRLPILCPVAALEEWLNYPGSSSDHLFPRASRKVLPGQVSSRGVLVFFNKLMAAQNRPTLNKRSLRYSLYFFLMEIGWSRRKILKHVPFYRGNASRKRLAKTSRDTSSHRIPPVIATQVLSAITLAFEKSRYQPA